MNILLTTVSLDSQRGGGTAERTRRLAEHLCHQSHQCVLATMQDGDLADDLRSKGMSVYATGVVKLRLKVPLISPLRLTQMVREADVIHLLGYWNLLSVVTAFLAAWFGKAYVLSAAGEFVGLDQPRPIALAFHHIFGKRVIRHANLLIAITRLEQQQIMQRFGLPRERVIVVPNGVEEPAPQADAAVEFPEAPFLLFVGRLASVKGPDLLVKAFSDVALEYPNLTLVMAGPDFGMLSELKSLIDGAHLENRVIFTGHLGEIDKSEAYCRALFLIVPSRAEAMSLVALEAGIVGTPVLLTDQCGFDEVEAIGGGQVVPASIEGLRAGLRSMLGRPSSLTAEGQALRSYVSQNYAWPAIVKRLIAHFEELLVKNTARQSSNPAGRPGMLNDSGTERVAAEAGRSSIGE